MIPAQPKAGKQGEELPLTSPNLRRIQHEVYIITRHDAQHPSSLSFVGFRKTLRIEFIVKDLSLHLWECRSQKKRT